MERAEIEQQITRGLEEMRDRFGVEAMYETIDRMYKRIEELNQRKEYPFTCMHCGTPYSVKPGGDRCDKCMTEILTLLGVGGAEIQRITGK